jgi:hypothetical protein
MSHQVLVEREPNIELRGHVLDLGRPELAPLMDRYVSSDNRTTPGLLDPPKALIVSRQPGQEAPLLETLENDAWSVQTCAGPGGGDCPVMRGERCSLRESVDVAVVFVAPKSLHGGSGSIARLRCAADSASPGVVALEQSFDPIRYGRGIAIVGALRGPRAVLEAASELLHQRDP